MIRVLDSHEARETVFPISVDFYHEAGRLGLIGEDVELLQGVLFRKMPKFPLHQWLLDRLRRMLESFCPPQFFVRQERPITCADSEPEPDLAVVAGSWEDYREAHPRSAELVIEIAISTAQRDRGKAAIYAAAGIKEYWLIEPEANTITLHTQPGTEGYLAITSHSAEETARSTVFPEFSLSLAELMK